MKGGRVGGINRHEVKEKQRKRERMDRKWK